MSHFLCHEQTLGLVISSTYELAHPLLYLVGEEDLKSGGTSEFMMINRSKNMCWYEMSMGFYWVIYCAT